MCFMWKPERGFRVADDRGLVDEIVLYVAPCFMGSGKVLASLPHFERMQDIYRWRYHAVATAGSDLKIVLRPQS